MSVHPTQLGLSPEGHLLIDWNDGERRLYRVRQLRDECPCATCREKRGQPAPLLPVITPAETTPLTIAAMPPVGNYAYAIHFSDGHDTGIFTLERLRELGEVIAP